MSRILLVAGTRPNFIKLAPLYHRIKQHGRYETFICHTGQHYDFNMSDVFWQHLEIPEPNFRLNIKADGVVDTIGKTIIGMNDVVRNNKFDLVIVFGDVNATVAGAIVAVQSRIKLMHVEAGLRSFDRKMPEEINRIITDHISDYLMVSEPSGIDNLRREGFDEEKFYMAGNIMIESLIRTKEKWEGSELPVGMERMLNEHPVLVTFHRSENVDKKENLDRVVSVVDTIAKNRKAIFPVHPRTKSKLIEYGLNDRLENNRNILLSEPMSYFSFLKAISKAGLVVTDSGGIQEETSYLNVPCVTFRRNTERPVTSTKGTNLLLDIWQDDYIQKIDGHTRQIKSREAVSIPLWDDEVSARIVSFIDKVV